SSFVGPWHPHTITVSCCRVYRCKFTGPIDLRPVSEKYAGCRVLDWFPSVEFCWSLGSLCLYASIIPAVGTAKTCDHDRKSVLQTLPSKLHLNYVPGLYFQFCCTTSPQFFHRFISV